jgi:hypothetical protein
MEIGKHADRLGRTLQAARAPNPSGRPATYANSKRYGPEPLTCLNQRVRSFKETTRLAAQKVSGVKKEK